MERALTSRVFEAGGLLRASRAAGLDEFLRRQPGVEQAEANPVSQTVTVQYDEAALTANDVRALIERFGCSCGGEVVPCHLCRDEQPADAIGFARRGGFELIAVQRLRPHYALTLRAWVERLEASADVARRLVDEEVYRTWRIYTAAARRGFEDGSLDVAQLLLARPGAGGRAQLPRRPW